MPALVVFNRKWWIGSDDFVFPALVLLIIRLAWLIVIVTVFSIHEDSLNCLGGTLLYDYYIGLLVLLPLKIIVNIAMMLTSMRGSVMDSKARKLLPAILYAKLTLLLAESVWGGLLTYWVFGDSSECEVHIVVTVKVLVIFGWCFIFSVLVAIAILFDRMGSSKSQHHSSKIWQNRCKFICCALASNQSLNDAFSEVASIVAEFFQDVDLVPTDIAVGLGLVYRKQRKDRKNWLTPEELATAASSGSGSSEQCQRPAWMCVDMAAHYMKYALASYGWPMYAYSHPPCGCFKLCCLTTPAPEGYDVMEDRCCFCNLGAIQKTVNLSHTEIVYASFRNELYENPFFIGIDHHDKSVVVAIRGTLSLKDGVVDINAAAATIEELKDESCQCHQGMLRAAVRLKATLETDNLLQSAFSGRAAFYKLVVTGHSLGAGVAALLAILMKEKYPGLLCYSFSPPGGLMSPSASTKTKDWIMSVVLGDDLVPRLSLRTMASLKEAVIVALSENHIPKYRLIASGCWHILCALCSLRSEREEEEDSLSQPLSPGNVANYMSFVPVSEESRSTVDSRNPMSSSDSSLMFGLPGHILFIGDKVEARSKAKTGYFFKWMPPSAFDRILVSQNMAHDHLPNIVQDTLFRIATYGGTRLDI